MERIKKCPVCGELVAVWQGDPAKYGDRAEWNWNRFIRLKYCCDECRELMNGQSVRLAVKRFRKKEREQRAVLIDVVEAYREELRVSREEARLSRERIAELEAARGC